LLINQQAIQKWLKMVSCMPFHKIKNAPPEVFRDRTLLIAIILAVWASIKLIEACLPDRALAFLPGPFPLAMLFVVVAGMVSYSIIIYVAQKWKARNERNKSLKDTILVEPDYFPSIDIFVPAHNERNVILETLQNLLQIDYPNFKIWILDDRSVDKTALLVKEFIAQNELYKEVTLIERGTDDKPGKSAALNQALSMTNGEFIVVFDADARVQPNCLKLAVGHFKNPSVGAVQFQKKIHNANYNTLTLCQDLEMAFDTYLQLGREAIHGSVELRGNGQIASRKCLLEVGGWDERTLTDDLELSTRIHSHGWDIKFLPEVVVEEEGVLTPQALFRQRRRWAEGSLRRYLTHFYSFIDPKGKMSINKRLDILPFLTQFAIPIWVFLDLILEVVHFWTNQQTHITILMLATFLTSLNMWVNICIAVRRWRNYSSLQALHYGTLAFFYGVSHWPPIVLWTIRKVIFGRRQTEWTKTPRMFDIAERKRQDRLTKNGSTLS
jgi:1,2-diacylglycerol 3-beta-glucosyltransferase